MEVPQTQTMVDGEHSPKEVAKLIGVLLAITVTALLFWSVSAGSSWQELMTWFMGVFFVVFAGFKLVGYKMFVAMYPGYDIVAQRVKAWANAYPFVELLLGVLYLWNLVPTARDWLTLIIMAVGSIGVAQELKRRRGIHCACLGNIIKLPLSTVSLVEDVGMGVMALAMITLR